MKEEKLGKNDYEATASDKFEDAYGRAVDEVLKVSAWQQFKYKYSDLIFKWVFGVIIIGCLGFACFGMVKCTQSEIARMNQQEIEWTTGDSTFVKKQDGYYIYRREIEGHKYYLYKHKDQYGDLVNDQYVPVNSCTDEP